MDRQQAIDKINTLAPKGIPFLFIIDFEMIENHVWELNQIPPNIYASFSNKINIGTSPKKNHLNNFKFTKEAIRLKDYQSIYEKIISNIRYGNSYLVNLTFPTPIETSLSLLDIYIHSEAPYKLYFDNKFVVFSPESFITIRGMKIMARPMKGTIDEKIKNAEFLLLNDQKELAEHHTVVDLLRNDLSLIAQDVTVEKFRYIERVRSRDKTLLQTSSLISGTLQEDYRNDLGDRLYALLPAGSITGAPKKETMKIILENENYKRGYYSGIMGIYDGKNLDSAVMIRYIEQDENNKLIFKSGGGITASSSLKKEYDEMINKVYVPIY